MAATAGITAAAAAVTGGTPAVSIPSRQADVYRVDLRIGRITDCRKLDDDRNEAEGMFPDGWHILVESGRDRRGSRTIDFCKVRLEPGSSDFERLARFGDFPGYRASNPIVSPDERTIAFRQGRLVDEAGVGCGVVLLDVR